jgi:hypothetical protein
LIGVFGLSEGFVALPFQALYLGVDLLRGAHRYIPSLHSLDLGRAAES